MPVRIPVCVNHYEILGFPDQPPRRPRKNEDRMGYCYTRESGLFVLADGMGGHPEGEVAAQIALQTVSALFQRQAKPQIQDVQEFLSGALLAAHHQILRYAV